MKYALTLLIVFSGAALAATPSLNVFNQAYELSDSELSAFKGKYVDSGQDYYFGLQMQTEFIGADGSKDRVTMQIEFNGSAAVPAMTIKVSEAGAVNSPGNELEFNTLGQAAGLQQRIQISGDSNLAINDLDFAQGQLATQTDGVELTIGTTLVSTRNNTTFSAQPLAIGYQVELASGNATQGVSYQDGKGQLLQSIFIDGINHGVINRSTLRYDGISIGVLESGILSRQINSLRNMGP